MLIYVNESGENLSSVQGQGVAKGTIPQAPNHYGGAESLRRAPKVPTTSHVLSSTQYICFRKTSFVNMGTTNLFLDPGAI